MKRSPLVRKTPLKRTAIKKPKSTKLIYRSERAAPTVKQLDNMWAVVVKLRSNYECEMWGVAGRQCSSIMNAHHIFSRRNSSTRWDAENGMCLCQSHHMWLHNEPVTSTNIVRDLIEKDRYSRIFNKHFKEFKHTADDRRAIYQALKAELAELEGK